jgi:hypothetical protein
LAGWRKNYVRDHPYSVTFVGAIRRNTVTVLRLEVAAEFTCEDSSELQTSRVLEDATCVAGFGGLSS